MKSAALLFLAGLAATTTAPEPLYKDPRAKIDDRVADLLERMTLEDKAAQLVQGDIANWINTTDGTFNRTGLEWSMKYRASQFYVGYPTNWSTISHGIRVAQDYLVHNTTLGIPALVQSEGIHGFLIPNATIFNSPIGYACSWNPALVEKMAGVVAKEALALGVNQIFAPLADLSRVKISCTPSSEANGEQIY